MNINEQHLDQILKLVKEYIYQDKAVLNHQSSEEIKAKLGLQIEANGDQNLLFQLKQFLDFSPRTIHPQFNNQLYGGFNLEAFSGEVFSFLTNTSMATFEISPVATLMEQTIIELLANLLGYAEHDGIMVTGGSNGNLMGMHCARFAMNPESKKTGNSVNSVIFVSDQAHYSFKKSANLLGIGTDNIVKVATDANKKMLPSDLELKIKRALEEGKTPTMLALTLGTTVFGAFDNIEELYPIAKKYNLWVHGDGAWGGAALFSKRLRSKFKGCEKLDSFVIDFHKFFGTGLITSFFVVNKKNYLTELNDVRDSVYLFHEYAESQLDLGVKSVQCGRKNDVLKAWLYMKNKGLDGLERQVDSLLDLQDYFYDSLVNLERVELIGPRPEYLNTCFRVRPLSNKSLKEFNLELRYRLIHEGKAMVNFSEDREGIPFFRMTFANSNMTRKDVDHLINLLLEIV